MFSQRVWDNTNALADGLKHDMLVGIMAGKSEQHMADDIMNRCGVGAFEARRLVRTETTCVANTAELYGYKELDIDEYEFSACLDSRTSDLCRELDGKVFKRNSAQAGVNLPPMHPFCRSTMLPVLPSEEDLDKELAELGDEIGADVDFDEWEQNLQQGEDGKWRYVAGSAGKVKANKPMRFAGNGVDKSKKNGIINNRKLSISDRILEWNDEDKILEYSPDEVEAELLKSEIGREANEYIVDNNIIINFDYSQFSLFDEELCLGEVISSKDIAIYPNNCKSVSALAKTIIHEVEHLKINSDYNTQKEEVRCKLAEIKDTKNNYDYSDIRRTITEVKKINGYNGMSWR